MLLIRLSNKHLNVFWAWTGCLDECKNIKDVCRLDICPFEDPDAISFQPLANIETSVPYVHEYMSLIPFQCLQRSRPNARGEDDVKPILTRQDKSHVQKSWFETTYYIYISVI